MATPADGSGGALEPGAALDPEAVYSCYLGGLAIEDEQRRLQTAAVLLLLARLGLRPGEILHCHEGWIDWRRGELTIPDQEPCACDACWGAARAAQRAGDGRDLGTIVTEDAWSPPGEGGRTVSFGWSKRLTAALATLFQARDYPAESAETIHGHVQTAAENAAGIDPDGVDPAVLRASAGQFFAAAGFDAPRVANLLGIEVEAATPFARAAGGHARDHLYTTLASGGPQLCGPDPAYPLVCDPEPFDREPFDSTAFDAQWRRQQAEATGGRDRLRNPRPPSVPAKADYDLEAHAVPDYLDVESEVVAADGDAGVVSTLGEWVDRTEADRGDGAAQSAQPDAPPTPEASTGTDAPATGATAGGATGEPDDPRDLLTEPVVASIGTEFACQDAGGGQPVAGRVMLGQDELLVAVDDDGSIEEYHVVDLDDVTDVSLDYVPSSLAGVFESTVGVAYETDGDRRVAILELPGKKQHDFANTIFKLLLSVTPVVATHPARKGGRVTDEDPRDLLLYLRGQTLVFGEPDEGEPDNPEFSIRLSDVIHIERGKQTADGTVHRGLSIRHLKPNGQAVTTAIAPEGERNTKLLERFVGRYYRERKEEVKHLDLSADQKEVLVALYSTGDGMDITMILDQDAGELSELLASLKQAELVRQSGDGARLTGKGQMIVSDKVDDVNV